MPVRGSGSIPDGPKCPELLQIKIGNSGPWCNGSTRKEKPCT